MSTRVHKFNKRVTIQQLDPSLPAEDGATGEPQEVWRDIGRVWASVKYLPRSENDYDEMRRKTGEHISQRTGVVYMRSRPITVRNRLVFKGRVFHILSISLADEVMQAGDLEITFIELDIAA